MDWVLRARQDKTYEPGIKTILVYPMNALANSQLGQLRKFLSADNPPVTFERYTVQESSDKRASSIANPPDILLTNYVMLGARPRASDHIEMKHADRVVLSHRLLWGAGVRY